MFEFLKSIVDLVNHYNFSKLMSTISDGVLLFNVALGDCNFWNFNIYSQSFVILGEIMES